MSSRGSSVAEAPSSVAHGGEHAPETYGEGASADGAHGEQGGEHGGGHAGHGKSHAHHEDHGPGTPPWLISFGDMMTLFLCFFIMLVTMAPTQDAGLMAKGLGPFIAALESHGMDGALDGSDVLQKVNLYRRRFGLAPLTDEEYLTGAKPTVGADEIEKIVKQSLRRHFEVNQPAIALFADDSSALSEASMTYLDRLAETLRPGRGQELVLEGHADDAGPRFNRDRTRLALARACAVRDYLVREQSFVPTRVEARAWTIEDRALGASPHGVDARVIEPEPSP